MITSESRIGEIVAANIVSAAIFESLGIDYCCKGNRTIDEVCKEKEIDSLSLLSLLNRECQDSSLNSKNENYNDWSLEKLADHIEQTHHQYTAQQIPILREHLDRICNVHGDTHPELFEIKQLFEESAKELLLHMKKEEFALFPYIKELAISINNNAATVRNPPFKSAATPISVMMQEHDHEGERFRKISELSSNYTPPVNACNTYRVTFKELQDFEQDLHRHIHLENNILFPKALKLEESISNQQ